MSDQKSRSDQKNQSDQKKQLSLLYPVLDTKLFIPEMRSEQVRRKRLVDRLNDGIGKRLILISAPAGFGKTTLLSEWISQSGTPAAWLSLDASDNDPNGLIQYLIAALQTIEPDFASDVLEILGSPHQLTVDSVMLFLIKEIETFPTRFILVLDDYHLINTKKINRIIDLLLERMPPQMCLAIGTRVDPEFPFSRLRVADQLTEIRISDLYFTKEEAVFFFKQVMPLDLEENDIDRLLSRTEGWVAGLQLAALSMKGQEDIRAFIDSFAGNDRLVVDYLTEEVLFSQSGETQDFLLKTSILDRLSESLCESVTREKNCQRILEDLEQQNLFLVPLDNKRQWYRYHHLFADLLQQRLLLNNQERVEQLHQKASDWYHENGFIEEAIDHAIAANDFRRAAGLMEIMLSNSWQSGEQVMIINWLKLLPDPIILSYPNLCICHSNILFERGQHDWAEAFLGKLDASLSANPAELKETCESNPLEKGDLSVSGIQGRIAAQRAYWATLKGDLENIDIYSQQALDHLNKKDDAWKMLVYLGSAISNEARGNVDAALKTHYEAVDAARRSGSVYYHLFTRVWLAIILKTRGRLPESIEICRHLLREVDEKKLKFNNGIGSVFGAWGEMIYERNELEESYKYAKKGVVLLEEGHDIHHIGWRYVCLGKILCSMQDIDSAEALIPKMEALLSTGAIPPWIASSMEEIIARIWLMGNQIRKIEAWVEQNMIEPESGLNRFFESKYIELSRILIHLDRYEEAQRVISPLLIKQENEGRGLHQMETLMVQTQIHMIKNRTDDAIDTLVRAFSIAEPGGYLRVFSDERKLVRNLLEQFSDSQIEEHRNLIMKLRAEFEKGKTLDYSHGLVEPLSKREVDVLRLISAGLTNKKTAESLFISVNTLKTHLQNIYGKLGVHNRTEAVFSARELGFLD